MLVHGHPAAAGTGDAMPSDAPRSRAHALHDKPQTASRHAGWREVQCPLHSLGLEKRAPDHTGTYEPLHTEMHDAATRRRTE